MHDTLRCPGCGAELTLPKLPTGQDVQCPRCQKIFEPKWAPANTPAPEPKRPILRDDADDDWPSDPRRLVRPDPLTGQWKAIAAAVALALSVLSYGLQAYLTYERGRALGRPEQAFLFAEPPMGDRRVPQRLARPALYHELTFWPALIFFLIWIHQASHNLKLLQCAGMSHTPAMSVVSFFVPIMNLYRPYFIMQEIWRGSDPRAVGNSLTWIDAPKGVAVRAWWLSFLAALALRVISGLLEPSGCLVHLCMIAAGGLLILIIYAVATRQRERYERLYED